MSGASILTVTVNPALDLTTSVGRIEPLRKLRCSEPVLHPGGGGANVSRAIRELGGSSLAFVVLAGRTGQSYIDLLRRTGVECIEYHIPGETRTSFTVMEDETGLHYRFVLPGPVLDLEGGEKLIAELDRLIASGVRYIVASGSLLPGIAEDFYRRLGDLARGHDVRLILDTHGSALRLALGGRPYLVRLNDLEIQELAPATDLDPAASPALIASRLVESKAVDVVVVGLGEQGSLVTTAGSQFIIRPPRVSVHSKVGAGDSYVAALTLGLSRGWSLEAANRYGVAAAASAVTRQATQLCERGGTESYFNEIMTADASIGSA